MSHRTRDAFHHAEEDGEPQSYAIRRVYGLFEESGIPDPEHMLLMVAVLRAHRRLASAVAEVLARHDLNLSQYLLLMTLEVRGRDRPLLLSRLARRMLVHPTTVTLRMDELEKRGLVKREQHPSDRRAVLASLSPAGSELIDKTNREMAEIRFGLEGLTPETAMEIVYKLLPILGPPNS